MVVFAFGHAMAESASHVEVPRTEWTSTASDLGRTRYMDVAIRNGNVNGTNSKSDNDPHDYRAQLVTSIVDNFQGPTCQSAAEVGRRPAALILARSRAILDEKFCGTEINSKNLGPKRG